MILDKRADYDGGCVKFIFWLDGWRKKKEEIINEITKEIHPFVVLSSSCKYIYGITGRETEIHIFAVKMKIFEVNGEKDEDGEEAYLHNAS